MNYLKSSTRCNSSVDTAVNAWLKSKAICSITFKNKRETKDVYIKARNNDASSRVFIEMFNGLSDASPEYTYIVNNSNDVVMNMLISISKYIYNDCGMYANKLVFIDLNKRWKIKFKITQVDNGFKLIKIN